MAVVIIIIIDNIHIGEHSNRGTLSPSTPVSDKPSLLIAQRMCHRLHMYMYIRILMNQI